MSNRQARIARKRHQRETGDHFQHPVKVPTPFHLRDFIRGMVRKPSGAMEPRSLRRREQWLADRGLQYGAKGEIIPKES